MLYDETSRAEQILEDANGRKWRYIIDCTSAGISLQVSKRVMDKPEKWEPTGDGLVLEDWQWPVIKALIDNTIAAVQERQAEQIVREL